MRICLILNHANGEELNQSITRTDLFFMTRKLATVTDHAIINYNFTSRIKAGRIIYVYRSTSRSSCVLIFTRN